jgi:hypothetical protein
MHLNNRGGSFVVAVYWPCAGPVGPSGELRGRDNHCGHHQAAPAQGHAHRYQHNQEGGTGCLTHPSSGTLRAPGIPVVGECVEAPAVRSATLTHSQSIPNRGTIAVLPPRNAGAWLSFHRPTSVWPCFLYLQERLKALAAMAEAKRSSATSAQTIAARQAAAETAAKWKHGDSARVLFLSFELPAGERASPVRVLIHTCLMLCHSVRVTNVGVGLMSGFAYAFACCTHCVLRAGKSSCFAT